MQITATVMWVKWEQAGSDWRIIKTDKGTVVGNIAWTPRGGERLKLDGEWQENERFGDQFEFSTASIDVPDSPRGMLTYAVSQTKGMGES